MLRRTSTTAVMRLGALLVALVAATGCGRAGGATIGRASPSTTSSGALPCVDGAPPLRVVSPEGPTEVVEALTQALARAGYTIVTRPTPDELEVRVVARAQSLAGAGPEVAYGIAVDIVDGRERVDTVRSSFVAEPRNVTAETMRPLLAAIVEHGRVQAILLQRARAREKAEREAAARRARAEKDAKEEAEDREKRAWAAVGRAKCAAPRSTEDCVPLQRYLESFPDGPHAREARETLEKSRSTLARLEAHPTPAQHRVDCAVYCEREARPDTSCEHLTGRAQTECARADCFRTCMMGPPGE
jgi:hypothetical protein